MADTIDASKVPVTELLQRFEESKLYRRNYEDDWDKAWQLYKGDQWQGVPKLASFQSEPVYNKIFEFVEMNRAYLADNQWGVDVVPASIPSKLKDEFNSAEQNQQVAGIGEMTGADPTVAFLDMVDKVNKLLDFLWMENRMKSKLAEVILYMFIYGTGFLKPTYDPDNFDSGIGQIETKVVSPRYIFPDPNATSVKDASFIIEHHPVTYRWIIERYPDKAAEVKAKGLGSTSEFNEQKGSRPAGQADAAEAKRVDIYECWYLDSSIVEDSDSDKMELAYPNGRFTLMTSTGVVLEDKPNPYTMFPYVRFVEIPRPAEFFGDCTVTKVFGIQESINTILRAIIDNGLWLVHGIWITDTTSGVNPRNLAGYQPRDVITKNPGTEVRRDGGQALPQHMFEMLSQQEEAFDRVAGITNALRGIVPSRQPVQTTMLQQEAGEVRTRERQRRVEEALEELGKLWLDIASEYWSDKRVIRNKRMLGGFEMFEMSKQELAEWKFDVHVVPGSTSPTDSAQQLEKAFQLMERGGVQIPPMYLVEMSGLPNLYSSMAEVEADMAEEQVVDGEQPPMETEPLPQEVAPMEEELLPPDILPAQEEMPQL